ncbi:hypothetical protein O181_011163 [Austropuccinia psidii MF-1]|uniref:Integrase catalytic domain-containing protein n=1 Tax=Austropuccinia psidii MF-1 TaxID=1389203 RepID=A0A9Q3BUR4_9BASI|nr:hypothetical protein [Austropuccinia psidii MF-1]
MDTKISIEKSINIKSNDILQIAQRFQRRTTNLPLSGQPSIMAASTSRQQTPNRTSHQDQRLGNPSTSNQAHPPNNCVPISQQSESWEIHFLSPWFLCLHCYEWGHWAQDCPRKKAGKPVVEDPRIKNPNASLRKLTTFSHPSIAEVEVEEEDLFVAAIESIPENKLLVLLDSGATHHVTGDKNLFVSYRKINLTLSVASARQHQVEGKGTSCLACPSGDLLLKEVLHCPDIPGIVISVGKFMKNDGEVCFEKGRFVLSQKTCTYDSVLCRDRWFIMITPTAFCNSISSSNQEFNELLPCQLAHVLIRTIRRMQTPNCVEGLPKVPVSQNVRLCKACSLAKSKHTPFHPELRNIVTQPGDVIVADLMGPFPQSFNKQIYGMIIQDHFSSLVTFYPLKSKSEALQLLMHWVTQFKNLTPHSIKRVRTDNTGEFMMNSLKHFFNQQGIVHKTIVPYEHHQAGKIERTNRTIAEAARSMIFDSGLQPIIWPYAFRHACWVFNRVVHASQNMTPYELMTERKPNLALLRVFGCKAYVHHINHRKNLTPKSRHASAIFDESTATHHSLNAIEVQSVLDPTMVKELNGQDESIELFSATFSKDEVLEKQANQVLGTRWVYTTKKDSNGNIVRHKAWVVVQGYRQIQGLNFDETFALTPTFASLRSLFAIASANSWEVQTFDVTTAYLHSSIEENIFVKPPPGLSTTPGTVLKLNKALYGLKQAGRCWWRHLRTILEKLGFQANDEDQSTYTYDNSGEKAILWMHVDNGVITASSTALMIQLREVLSRELSLKWDTGIHSVVGIEVKREGNRFELSQPTLINKLCSLNPSNITAEQPLPLMDLSSEKARRIDKEYLSRIGMLLYIAQATRPDIIFSVNFLARFSMNTTPKHWAALDHLIAYMRGSLDKALVIQSTKYDKSLKVYVDANWGGEGSRSQHGFIVFLMGAPIAWNSKRQTCVASSTCQAEYMVMSFAAKTRTWISQNVAAITGKITPLLLSDNQSAVKIATNSGSRKNSRHIQREFHLINELITNQQVRIKWIASGDQKADIFTKKLAKIKVNEFCKGILS